MNKRTLFYQSAGAISLHNKQIQWEGKDGRKKTDPIEDIGFVVLESPQVRLTTALLMALVENEVAVILCDDQHMPAASLLPYASHTLAYKHLQSQIEASDAKRGRIWRQLVTAKIQNQAACVALFDPDASKRVLLHAKNITNGDPENHEAQAAFAYFSWFAHALCNNFRRDSEGLAPNNALNYGYAILRAAVARALVCSGLSCSLGVHHSNQYNPYGLADDVMEPYRPFIDRLVFANLALFLECKDNLTIQAKSILLSALAMDVIINDTQSPLMVAVTQTTASLVRALKGSADAKLKLPQLS